MYEPNTLLITFIRNLTPFQKFSLALHTLSFILYILGTFINRQLSNIQDIPSSDSYQTLQYIAYNLEMAPLASLILIPAFESCPQDFSIMTLMFWNQTNSTCSLPNNTYQNLRNANQSSFEVTSDINSQCIGNKIVESTIPITLWKSHKFCAQRLKKFVYVDKDSRCPDGFIQCSESLCISKEELCPITDIILDYRLNQDQSETSQSIDHTGRLEVFRSSKKVPVNDLKASVYEISCCEMQNTFSMKNLNETKVCNKYGEDKTAKSLDMQALDFMLEENHAESRNTTSLGFNNSKYRMGFLAETRSIVKEKNETLKINLNAFQERLTKIGGLKVIAVAFMDTEFLLFIMFLFLKQQFLVNLLLLYCILQVCIGLYGTILTHSFNKIRTSVTYLFLHSPPLFLSSELDEAVQDTKFDLDGILDALQLLSIWIIILSFARLIVFIAFVKLRARLINQPGSGTATLEVNRHQEAIGMLVALLPVAGETTRRNRLSAQDRFESEENYQRNQEIELEPFSLENEQNRK